MNGRDVKIFSGVFVGGLVLFGGCAAIVSSAEDKPATIKPVTTTTPTTPIFTSPPVVRAPQTPPPTTARSTTRPPVQTQAPVITSEPVATTPPPVVHYENCAAVRAAGAAPIYRGQPGYAPHLDRDNNGVGCES